MGALTLAVGGIIGGNTFDVLFIVFSDIVYRKGSIYHAMDAQSLFLIGMTLLLTSVLLMGLIRREKRGAGNIGFEGVLAYSRPISPVRWRRTRPSAPPSGSIR
jgi:cation:H+ antiporter